MQISSSCSGSLKTFAQLESSETNEILNQLTPVEITDREPIKSLTVCQNHQRTLLDPPHRKRKVCSLTGCQKPASSRRVNLKLSRLLYKVLKQHVPSLSGICWAHLKQVNEGSEGHGVAKANVTELQSLDIETAQLRETIGEYDLEMAEVSSSAKKVTQMEKVGEQENSRDKAIDPEIKIKVEAVVNLFEEKNSKLEPQVEEEKARSEHRLSDGDGSRKSKKQRMANDWSEDREDSQDSEFESMSSQDSFLEKNRQLEILGQLNRIFSCTLPPFSPEVRQGFVQCL